MDHCYQNIQIVNMKYTLQFKVTHGIKGNNKEAGDHMWCAILSESISLTSTGIKIH